MTSTTTVNVVLKLRRDTATNWASANPVLAAGEAVIDSTANKIKLGDGTTAYNSLGYMSGGLTLLDEDNFSSNSATSPPSQQSTKAYVDTADALKANLSGATFTGAVSAPSGLFTDDGSTAPVIAIRGDDAANWYGQINNDTYANSNTTGFRFYVADDGDAHFSHYGNAEYRDWSIASHDGTTSQYDIYRTAAGALYLYNSGNVRLTTTAAGITVTGTVTDDKGDLRHIPVAAMTGPWTPNGNHQGKAWHISSGGLTISNATPAFAAGGAMTIINDSSSDQTITQGAGVTMYNSADATTGNRTIAGRGMCTILWTSATQCYISGGGLS